MRACRYSHSISESFFDKSACFLHLRLITYLDRLLGRHGKLGEETLEMIHWILGPDIVEEDLLPLVQLLGAGSGRRWDREMEEEVHDAEAFSHFIERAFRKGSVTDEASTVALIRDLLKKRVGQLCYSGESEIEKNMSRFQNMFGLKDLEIELTLFFTILATYEEAESLFEYNLKCDRYAGRNNLKTILDCSDKELSRALNGRLTKIGVLESHSHRSTEIRIESEFVHLLLGSDASEMETAYFKRITPNPLPLDSHAIDSEIVRHALRLLSPTNQAGCALLLFGPPGVGKTTFAQGLAKEAGLDALLCRHEGKMREWERRMAIMTAVYAASENPNSVVLIDDCDAIIGTSHLWFLGNYDDKKWLHGLLESNARMIFIVNDTTYIEESVARRFSFSIAFKEFSRNQRVQLWKNILEEHEIRDAFTGHQVEDLAVRFNASPALIEQAVSHATLGDRHSGSALSRSISLALEAHEILLHGRQSRSDVKTFDTNLIIDDLNVSGGNLKELLQELEQFNDYLSESGSRENLNLSLLLYGFSGTGKTYLARYVAHYLDKELVTKRASDLLNKYIGETEKRIVRMYEEAEAKDAVLLIDEADSLLFNRDRAVRSWEISLTNQFLSSMEDFRGIQIFTSNRFDDLDPATLRRFTWKLKFDYLKPEAKVVFYDTILAPLVSSPLERDLEQELKRIPDLSPGDYKAVKSRFRFKSHDRVSHAALINALKEESKAKQLHRGQKAIGF